MKRIIVAIIAIALSLSLTASSSRVGDNLFPIETEATDLGYDSAKLNAFVDLSGITFKKLSYGFFWGTSETETNEKIVLSGESPSYLKFSFSANLKDLEPETKYWYKAFVVLGTNTFYGEVRNFTTDEFEMVAVDMGLSVKWSNLNLGALTPKDYGDFFVWGETKPRTGFRWRSFTVTKYCTCIDNWAGSGLPDNKTVLDPEDDAAYVNLGGKWRMPTIKEWMELLDESKCTWEWSSFKGTKGYVIKSKKTGNSIFLPAAGIYDDAFEAGKNGFYWSSSLNTDSPDNAWHVSIDSKNKFTSGGFSRSDGLSVRPVSE